MQAIQAIVPIFLLIVLGYLMGARGWLAGEAAAGLSKLTFRLLMPAVLFVGIARASLADGLSPMLLLGYFLPVLVAFAVINALVHLRRGRATPLGLAAAYSNNVLIGIPLVSSLLGIGSLVYVFAILVFHSLVLFSAHSLYAAFGGQEKVNPRALLLNLANPLVVGLLAGALLNVSGLVVPDWLWKLPQWLAQAALPCALIVLGLSLSRYRPQPDLQVLGLVAAKLLLFPLAVLLLGRLLPLDDTARAVLVLLAACPSGVNVLAFAHEADDVRVVGSTVFLSTALAAFSLPLWMHLVHG